MLEARTKHDTIILMENIFRTVAVMHIEVKNRHAIQPVRIQRVDRADGDVIEYAESHRAIDGGMVPTWPHRTERIRDLACHHHVHALHDRAGGTLRGDQRVWIHGRVWV